MANYFARKAGNINATDVWATTPTGTAADVFGSFTSSDVLYSNNFAITVNVNTTVGEVRNDNSNSATAGGTFTLSNGVTLTANVIAGNSTFCISFGGTYGNTAYIVGNVTGGPTTNCEGARNTSSGSLVVTGNVTGGINCDGIRNLSIGSVAVTGNVAGGASSNGNGIQNASSGSITTTGNVTGGGASACFGCQNASTGTATIVGSAFASNNAVGANNASTGILSVVRAVGNDWGIGATGMVSVVGVASVVAGSQTRVEEFQYGALGQAPTSGAVSTPDKTSNVCIVHRLSSTKKTLIDAASVSGALPAASDVRSGVSFNQGNTTGTLRVPAAGSVALGVLVDNTTGTAALTPAAVWDALTSGMTTSGSIGERLKNAATVATTGQQVADAMSA